jgi:hypothetical protein
MTVEEWEAAYIEHLQGHTKPEALSRVRREILKDRGEDVASNAHFGPEHPAVAAADNLCSRGVLVTHTDWLGRVEVAARVVADRAWPEKRGS